MKNQNMISLFFRKVPESLDAFFRPSILPTIPPIPILLEKYACVRSP
jgi:hypothetical protein